MITNITKTPQGNTGVIPTQQGRFTFCVDWLQGTFNVKYLKKVVKLVETAFRSGNFQERCHGIRFFEKSSRHPSGAVIGIGRKNPVTGNVDSSLAYLEISGSALSFMSQRRLRKLLRFLRKCKFKCTRIDLTIDDFLKKLNLNSIKRAIDANNYTGFGDTGDWYEKGRKGRKGKGATFGHRGNKGGGKYMEFYDKNAESKGRIDAHRIELACYDHYAIQAFEDLTEAPLLLWGNIIKSWINGAIDFRKRKHENDKNPGRRPRLRWWEKIMKDAVVIKPAVFRPAPSFDKLKFWIKSQVAPSLALIFNALYKHDGLDDEFWQYFWDILADGNERLRDKHHWIYDQYILTRNNIETFT